MENLSVVLLFCIIIILWLLEEKNSKLRQTQDLLERAQAKLEKEQYYRAREHAIEELHRFYEEHGKSKLFGSFGGFISDLNTLHEKNKKAIDEKISSRKSDIYELIKKSHDAYLIAYSTIIVSSLDMADYIAPLIKERQKLVDKFGELSESDTDSKWVLERLITYSGIVEKNPELTELINYIKVDADSINLLTTKDGFYEWDDENLKAYCDKFIFYILLSVEEYDDKPFRDRLELVHFIYQHFVKNNDYLIHDYKKSVTNIYHNLKQYKVSLTDLKKIDSYIQNLYKNNCSANLFNEVDALYNAIACSLQKHHKLGTKNIVDFITEDIETKLEDSTYHTQIQTIQKQFKDILKPDEQKIFSKICDSRTIIPSIIRDCDSTERYTSLLNWFPILVKLTAEFSTMPWITEQIFEICYEIYRQESFSWPNGKLGVTEKRIDAIRTVLKKLANEDYTDIKVEIEERIIAVSNSDDENDLPYINMKHAATCFAPSKFFDYRMALLRIRQYFRRHSAEDVGDILSCFQNIVLKRGNLIKAFRNVSYGNNHIVIYVQTDGATRHNTEYHTEKLTRGERALQTSLDFIPTKEGVWEYFLFASLPRFYGNGYHDYEKSIFIFSEQQIPEWFFIENDISVLKDWVFKPQITESVDAYFIRYVVYQPWGNQKLVYMKTTIDKNMPHLISNEKIDQVYLITQPGIFID